MTPGSPLSRLAAVLLLVLVVVAVIAGAVVPAVSAFGQQSERIATLRSDIARFERVAARRQGLEAVIADDPTTRTLREWLRPEASPALAAAEMQSRVSALVEPTGGRVTSTRVMPQRRGSATVSGSEQVVLNVRLSIETEALQQVLYRLESELPLTLIDEVQVRARRRRSARQQPARTQLDVQLVLMSFVARPEAKSEEERG